jgi:hypothetical protein
MDAMGLDAKDLDPELLFSAQHLLFPDQPHDPFPHFIVKFNRDKRSVRCFPQADGRQMPG